MYTRLNLSSAPFRNRTLPWAITGAVMGTTLIALALILGQVRQARAQADAVEADLAGERQRANALQAEASKVIEAMAPEELRALQGAQLLVDRKRFSWSRLFLDLEASVPSDVRVTQINVRDVLHSGGQTYADLEMTVTGRDASNITGMINEMSRGGVFDVEPLTQGPQKARGERGTEFTLLVRYRPRASTPGALPAPIPGATPTEGGAR